MCVIFGSSESCPARMTHCMVMILSGLLKHVRGGLDLKRFDHILIRVGGGTGTKKKSGPIPVL